MQKYAVKIKTTQDHPASEILIDCWRLKNKKFNKGQEPIYTKVEKLIKKTDWSSAQNYLDIPPPWNQQLKLIIDLELTNQRNKNDSIQLDETQITKKLQEYEDYLTIYTDASRATEGSKKSSIAFFIPDTQEKENYRISDCTNILTAELLAIKIALQNHIQKSGNETVKKLAIFCDSLRALQEIQQVYYKKVSNTTVDIVQLADNLSHPVTLVWIPGHAGVTDNEVADELAKNTLKQKQIKIICCKDIHEINQEIEDNILVEWQERYTDADEGTWYKRIEPKVTTKLKHVRKNRKKDVILTRIRFGKCMLNAIKHKMDLHPNENCDFCQVKETIEHYLFDCIDSKIGERITELIRNKYHAKAYGKIIRDEEIMDEIYKLIERDL